MDFQRGVSRSEPFSQGVIAARIAAVDENKLLSLRPEFGQAFQGCHHLLVACPVFEVQRQTGGDDFALAIDQRLVGNVDVGHGGQSEEFSGN